MYDYNRFINIILLIYYYIFSVNTVANCKLSKLGETRFSLHSRYFNRLETCLFNKYIYTSMIGGNIKIKTKYCKPNINL